MGLLIPIVSILVIIFWVRILVDALTRDFKDSGTKIAWVLVIFFGQLLGTLIYYFVVYTKNRPKRPFVLVVRICDIMALWPPGYAAVAELPRGNAMSWMRSTLLIPVLLIVCCLQARAEVQKLQAGDVTISYPPGLEQQAKHLAKVLEAVAPERIARAKHIRDAFADPKAITKKVTDLMGCPEGTETGVEIISAFSKVLEVYSGAFTDFRLYKESDLKASGGLKEGPVQLVYDPKTSDFSTNLSFGTSTSDKAFTPLVVKDDGSFATKGLALEAYVTQSMDDGLWGMLAPIHEATESILVRDLGIGHPLSRWFNEGVGNWVMLTISAQIEPSLEKQFRPKSMPRPEDAPLKPKINLPAWSTSFLAKANLPPDEQKVSDASYRFATEAVDRMLKGQPSGTLAKIIGKLKAGQDPDSDTICKAVKEVTGKDAKSILLEYVPAEVRTALKNGEPEKLLNQVWMMMQGEDYPGARKALERLAEMTPCDVNVRMNLACALRKTGAPKPESDLQIKAAGVLMATSRDMPDIKVFGSGPDGGYVLGRTLQLAGFTEQAKNILKQVLQMDPNHADAQAAMKELDSAPKP